MNVQPRNRICLQRRDLWHTNHVIPGSSLSCDSGVLWVTQTGDLADYILLPGGTVTVIRRGNVLVQAMRDAAFHLA